MKGVHILAPFIPKSREPAMYSYMTHTISCIPT